MILVAQGRYRVRIGDDVWTGQAGDVFVYPPGCLHRPLPERLRSNRHWVLRWTGGSVDLGASVLRCRDIDGRISMLCSWLEGEKGDPLQQPEPLAQAIWWAVVEILRRHRTGTPQPAEGIIDRLRRIIAELAGNPLSLRELADLVGLSPSQLVRRCRRETGQTPMRLLRRERIDRAMRLLQVGDERLHVIARQVGLADAAHLSHVFRAERGESPGAFRARSRRTRAPRDP